MSDANAMDSAETTRRPLKTRSAPWAQSAARSLSRTALTPNQISVASVVFAAAGSAALLALTAPWSLLVCAACIQLRLLCNMLDGMVAVEGGKSSPAGALYNELPDRIADSLFIVSVGYAVSVPWLGWCSALFAALTAYIRAVGAALGLSQDFRGPMAKPHRMAVLTIGCLIGSLETSVWHSDRALLAAECIVGLGSIFTCVARTRAIARQLGTRPG
jgi:phosphatidylglycerophosphate synthase